MAAALGTSTAEFLGRGTFGDTWRVGDSAVKVICSNDYPPERVQREVAGLMRVSSPFVVRLLSANTIVLGGKEWPALTFEYIDGGDLQQRIDAEDRPDSAMATALLVGLLTGVQALHNADGTVHRDIKPANIALRGGAWDQPLILDLGLAKSASETTFTQYPGLVGTATYMAPEQLAARRARKAADLFAVGVTVRVAITGEHPFLRRGQTYSYGEAIEAIKGGPAPLPAWLGEDTRSVLDRMVCFAEHDRGSSRSNLKRLGSIHDGR
ncbi:serine/threonine-protein kinase [Nocardia sp.]|uniref:serine/threonine-protein kinase n=1 Tax=Nocardia sp. TaxID=1821 RepID=UPI0026025F20|nr:serine/threonine-protein kinase [Nocardia sp.]